MQPAETPHPLIRTAEALLERQTALVRRRQDASWPRLEESYRLLETMSQSLVLLRRSVLLDATMKAQRSTCVGLEPSLPHSEAVGAPSPVAGASAEAVDLAHAIEQERRRIARELHDTVGQQLCAMRLTVVDGRKSRKAQELRQRLALLESLVAAADQDLDRAVFALHPPALGPQGLTEAVQQHVSHWFGLFGVPVDLLITGLDRQPPPPAVAAAAYRIVQECLTNIAKHAQASRVGVALSVQRGQLHLSIEDDGLGFVPSATTGGRLGLVGMGERVAALQGRFDVESAPGEGTTVLVALPLRLRQEAGAAQVAPLGR